MLRELWHRRALTITALSHFPLRRVLAFWALIAYCLSQSPSVPFAIGALVIMWFSVDLFGAVLHVVLDTAAFVNFPLIGAGCLEFQWHHAIPVSDERRGCRGAWSDVIHPSLPFSPARSTISRRSRLWRCVVIST
jgi:hypothetical protein